MSDQRSGIVRVGISACLLGERVRYDGEHKRAAWLDDMARRVEWVPVCPEVEVGMGVPREPVRLERTAAGARMVAVQTRVDHTDAMQAWAARRIEALAAERICGYVLKKDSPSCGLGSVKVFDRGGAVRPDGRGLFADALVRALPGLPVIEEDALDRARTRVEFLARCATYRDRAERLAPLRRVRVVRVGGDGAREDDDLAATEEPLEIRLHGTPFVVVMRTPGHDRELAAGFLLSEGVIRTAADLGAVEHCRHPDHPEAHNIVDVFLLGEAAASLDARLADRRRVPATSSCGLCGRTSIESLRVRAAPLPAREPIARDVAASLTEKLRAHQSLFDATGGLHAAALFSAAGACEAAAEDVGRHNAVDKVIGAMLLREQLPLSSSALAVSGRASYEIVQKAWLAGVGLVSAVSAPSSLAIDLADEAGITLLGFVRGGSFNIYTHPERIRPG